MLRQGINAFGMFGTAPAQDVPHRLAGFEESLENRGVRHRLAFIDLDRQARDRRSFAAAESRGGAEQSQARDGGTP